ncbi:MAG: hypothetical protein C5B50_06475 [Verrucomicrobia bacterium]|nr:MAG: hypothetical protein C5B50_06475 [Verrucomicrobiota bacterium]
MIYDFKLVISFASSPPRGPAGGEVADRLVVARLAIAHAAFAAAESSVVYRSADSLVRADKAVRAP